MVKFEKKEEKTKRKKEKEKTKQKRSLKFTKTWPYKLPVCLWHHEQAQHVCQKCIYTTQWANHAY